MAYLNKQTFCIKHQKVQRTTVHREQAFLIDGEEQNDDDIQTQINSSTPNSLTSMVLLHNLIIKDINGKITDCKLGLHTKTNWMKCYLDFT